jgi:hypothetical protein
MKIVLLRDFTLLLPFSKEPPIYAIQRSPAAHFLLRHFAQKKSLLALRYARASRRFHRHAAPAPLRN